MEEQFVANIQASYDCVAEEYARRIFDELQYKPIDQSLLDRLAQGVPPDGSSAI